MTTATFVPAVTKHLNPKFSKIYQPIVAPISCLVMALFASAVDFHTASKPETAALVAAFTVTKVVRPERAPVVVAAGAARGSLRGEVHRRDRGTHLARSNQLGPNGMTSAAAHAAMAGVAESFREGFRGCRKPDRPARSVACVARPQIFSGDLAVRPMTLEARRMPA